MKREINITVCCENEDEYFVVTDVLQQLGLTIIADPLVISGSSVNSIFINSAHIKPSNDQGFVKV